MSNNNVNIKVGQQIKSVRELRGYSQADLANKLKINRASLSQLESGKQQITVSLIYKLAQVLETDVTTFLLPLNAINSESTITAKLSQEDITDDTKSSILRFITKTPDNDK